MSIIILWIIVQVVCPQYYDWKKGRRIWKGIIKKQRKIKFCALEGKEKIIRLKQRICMLQGFSILSKQNQNDFFFCLIKTLIEGQEQGTTNVVVVVIVVEIVCCLRFNMYTTKEIWFVSVVN